VHTQEQIREDLDQRVIGDGKGLVVQAGRYALMTAAYNEAAHIEKTILSVLNQTILPLRWVIVSDSSNDGTDEIVRKYAAQHDFLRFLRVNRAPGHSFRSKVVALKQAASLFEGVTYDFIGNLDADITVGPTYFEELMTKCGKQPGLGIVSGYVHEQAAGEFRSRKSNRTVSVPHAAQLVRRECYESIGGYSVLRYGGEDWYAQTSARMNGWGAESIPALPIFHHKPTGTGSHLLRHRYRLGKLDYSFGSHPLFEVAKCLRHMSDSPLMLGGVLRMAGFLWSYVRREPRAVSEEFMAFLRQEQVGRFYLTVRPAVRPAPNSKSFPSY
jgi:biofilm PGA synthesis N-glycosyltransferase PgaC